jgi:hypothetical protein
MRLHITSKFVIAFLALNGVISELHEQAHITTGRIVHGCYGPRDFNVWQTCADGVQASPLAASVAGPLFSYAIMWLGVWLLLRGRTMPVRSVGFSLIFAPLPFARIFTIIMGGGDEKMFLTAVLGDAASPQAIRLLALGVVLAFCAPPIVIAWLALKQRGRGWYVAGFCVLPLVVIMAYKFKFLNGLLHDGFLATPAILGTPPLVLIVFGCMLVLMVAMWRHLQMLLRASPVNQVGSMKVGQSGLPGRV